MARKAAITCFIVLTAFALGGQYIFQMFGIKLPAFEIAGGLILVLIGLDMLEAKRSPTQEAHGDTEEAAAKEDAGIVPLGIPMLAGPGAISSVMVLVGQVPTLWNWEMGAILGSIGVTAPGELLGAGRRQPRAPRAGRDRHPHPGQNHGVAAGSAGHAVLREWAQDWAWFRGRHRSSQLGSFSGSQDRDQGHPASKLGYDFPQIRRFPQGRWACFEGPVALLN